VNDVAAESTGLHSDVLIPLASLVRRPILALENVTLRAICATAQQSRWNRLVGRCANHLDQPVWWSPVRPAGSKHSLCRHRALAQHCAVSASSRLRA